MCLLQVCCVSRHRLFFSEGVQKPSCRCGFLSWKTLSSADQVVSNPAAATSDGVSAHPSQTPRTFAMIDTCEISYEVSINGWLSGSVGKNYIYIAPLYCRTQVHVSQGRYNAVKTPEPGADAAYAQHWKTEKAFRHRCTPSPLSPLRFLPPHRRSYLPCSLANTVGLPSSYIAHACLSFPLVMFLSISRDGRGTSPWRERCFRRIRWAASSTCWLGCRCGKRGSTTGTGRGTVRLNVCLSVCACIVSCFYVLTGYRRRADFFSWLDISNMSSRMSLGRSYRRVS